METCSICLESLNDEQTFSLEACGHTFHTKCIINWFRNSKSCPCCRNTPELAKQIPSFYLNERYKELRRIAKLKNAPNDLKKLVDKTVCLIAFPHASNIIGEVNPVKDICTIAKEAGAFTCVDGVSYAPHGIPQINDFSPDIYLFSSYKTFGPHLGVMYVSDGLAAELESQCHYFNQEFPNKRFTPAGPDHAQVAALGGIYDYYDALSDHHLNSDLS